MNQELSEYLRLLIIRAMSYAQYSHNYILDEDVDDSAAIAYLNLASSKFAAAESLYYSRFEELCYANAKELFHLFDDYAGEFLNNYATNHSHRWTDLDFDRLEDCFNNSIFASKN